jgi:hypothetical protein
MALSVTIKASVRGSQDVALDLGTAILPIDVSAAFALADGTGADQANRYFSDRRTLTGAGGTEDLDLAGGITDAFGNVITMTKLKVLIFKNNSTTDTFQISRPVANGLALFVAASDAITVRPGGIVMVATADSTAYAVTAGTGDLLTITKQGSGSATYDIVLVGVG